MLIVSIVVTAEAGFGEITTYIFFYFLLEYNLLLEKKPQAILDDSNDRYYLGKKMLAAVILPCSLLVPFYLIFMVAPERTNIRPAITAIFFIIVLFTALYIDIRRREGHLRKSVSSGLVYGILITAVAFGALLFIF